MGAVKHSQVTANVKEAPLSRNYLLGQSSHSSEKHFKPFDPWLQEPMLLCFMFQREVRSEQ